MSKGNLMYQRWVSKELSSQFLAMLDLQIASYENRWHYHLKWTPEDYAEALSLREQVRDFRDVAEL